MSDQKKCKHCQQAAEFFKNKGFCGVDCTKIHPPIPQENCRPPKAPCCCKDKNASKKGKTSTNKDRGRMFYDSTQGNDCDTDSRSQQGGNVSCQGCKPQSVPCAIPQDTSRRGKTSKNKDRGRMCCDSAPNNDCDTDSRSQQGGNMSCPGCKPQSVPCAIPQDTSRSVSCEDTQCKPKSSGKQQCCNNKQDDDCDTDQSSRSQQGGSSNCMGCKPPSGACCVSQSSSRKSNRKC